MSENKTRSAERKNKSEIVAPLLKSLTPDPLSIIELMKILSVIGRNVSNINSSFGIWIFFLSNGTYYFFQKKIHLMLLKLDFLLFIFNLKSKILKCLVFMFKNSI